VKALMIGREQAVVDRMVSLVQAEGLDAAGTTSDKEAVSQLESGGVGGLVIGAGVEQPSRQHLSTVATAQGVAVTGGALAGKDPAAVRTPGTGTAAAASPAVGSRRQRRWRLGVEAAPLLTSDAAASSGP
jgi:hypothetical protein